MVETQAEKKMNKNTKHIEKTVYIHMKGGIQSK